MSRVCREIQEWIEEQVEQPIEEWVETTENRCNEQPWWNPVRWICNLVTFLVRVIRFVLVTVPKLITRVVCELILRPLTFLLSEIQPILCAHGIAFARQDLFNAQDALLFAKICKETYKPETADDPQDVADFSQIAPNLKVIKFIENPLPLRILSITDTQAYVLEEEGANRIIVSFRGSEPNPPEWVNNLLAFSHPVFATTGSPGKVHHGFWWAYMSVRDQLFATIVAVCAARELEAAPIRQICFTGHSLGGAVATLAAIDVRTRIAKKIDMCNYTYGSPRVGDIHFTSDYNEMIPHSFRVANEGDPIPQLPPVEQGMRYRHVKNLVYFDSRGVMSIEPCPRPAYEWPQEAARYLPPILGVTVSGTDALAVILLSGISGFSHHNIDLYISNLE